MHNCPKNENKIFQFHQKIDTSSEVLGSKLVKRNFFAEKLLNEIFYSENERCTAHIFFRNSTDGLRSLRARLKDGVVSRIQAPLPPRHLQLYTAIAAPSRLEPFTQIF